MYDRILSCVYANTDLYLREQLIPMLGLVALQHKMNPHSTVEKAVFLFDNAVMHSHILTTVISFSALGILVVLRRLKGVFKNYWFIYRLPEVLVVVIVSTCMSSVSPFHTLRL